jgi:carbon monoxide dehydrogenase subunit G
MTRMVLTGLVFLLLTGARAATAQAPVVSVREDHGVYRVEAQFEMSATPAQVLAVLSDYEHIARFMPGIKRSVVQERQDAHAVVEQEGESHLLMFTRRVHLVLDIQEMPDRLIFHDLCGRSFDSYAGMWRVVPTGAGSAVRYELAAIPAFDVPAFVLTRLLKRDSGTMIESLKKEVASRNLQVNK